LKCPLVVEVREDRALRAGLENRRNRKRAEACGVGTADGGRKGDPLSLGCRERGLRERVGAALDDRLVKEVGRLRGGQLRVDAVTACRLAEDRDVRRIAAEGTDVPLHPAKRRLLVHQAVIA